MRLIKNLLLTLTLGLISVAAGASTINPETSHKRIVQSRDFLLGVAGFKNPPNPLTELSDAPDSASETLRNMLDRKSPRPSPRNSMTDEIYSVNPVHGIQPGK